MSIRSMLEFNHDKYPDTKYEKQQWLNAMMDYLRLADPKLLPAGVTFFNQRHHSEKCLFGDPPYGWDNKGVKA